MTSANELKTAILEVFRGIWDKLPPELWRVLWILVMTINIVAILNEHLSLNASTLTVLALSFALSGFLVRSLSERDRRHHQQIMREIGEKAKRKAKDDYDEHYDEEVMNE